MGWRSTRAQARGVHGADTARRAWQGARVPEEGTVDVNLEGSVQVRPGARALDTERARVSQTSESRLGQASASITGGFELIVNPV